MSDGLNPSADASCSFCATHWTVILEAARPDSEEGRAAFGRLYLDYWRPVFSFVRRRGFSIEESEDITQNFFTSLLEKQALARLKREGGRFRSFLLGSLKNFLANEWDYQRAQKRGGGLRPLSLEAVLAEGSNSSLEILDNTTPELSFEKQWVMILLHRVNERLKQEQMNYGQGSLFEDLRAHLNGDNSGASYSEIALKHGSTEGAIKVKVHRLRQRFGLLLREEVARTVGAAEEVDDELRYLIQLAAQ